MRNLIHGAVSVFVVFLLTGCPYESQIPLSDSRVSKIDSLILGRWYGINPSDSNEIYRLNILNFNDSEYLIEIATEKNSSSQTSLQRGFITIINGNKIMNLKDLDTKSSYQFYLFELKMGKLYTSSFSDEFIKEKFTDMHEFYTYISKNIDKDKFTETKIEFRRF
jgi:hypothetical protein